ncbi:MAG: hypothetical protein M0002_17190 [Rhodospirillales bacterium]|nr:hypothetical protein [Rhodospirillales bacterium]
MLNRFRLLAVAFVIALGLIAQGMSVPAMAASGPGAVQSRCHSLHLACPGSGMTHHIVIQHCQQPCIPGAVLPGPSLMAHAVSWSTERFAATRMGLSAGLNLAPDPLPPRSRTLA